MSQIKEWHSISLKRSSCHVFMSISVFDSCSIKNGLLVKDMSTVKICTHSDQQLLLNYSIQLIFNMTILKMQFSLQVKLMQ